SEVYMTKVQTIHFKKAMEDKRRELLGDIHSQSSRIKIEDSEHDPIDQVQSMHFREESATHLGRRSRILAEIELSLHGISDSSYACASIARSRSASNVWRAYPGRPA